MSELEDLLRRSFAERSADIVAGPELVERARAVQPAPDRPRHRLPVLAAAAAAAAVVFASAWIGLRPEPAAPPGRAPTPVPTSSTPSTTGTPARPAPPEVSPMPTRSPVPDGPTVLPPVPKPSETPATPDAGPRETGPRPTPVPTSLLPSAP